MVGFQQGKEEVKDQFKGVRYVDGERIDIYATEQSILEKKGVNINFKYHQGGYVDPDKIKNLLLKSLVHINNTKEDTMIFEVLIVEQPSKNDMDNGELEKIVLGPVAVVARDKDSACSVVIMDNADKLKGVKKERMKTFVRPFC